MGQPSCGEDGEMGRCYGIASPLPVYGYYLLTLIRHAVGLILGHG